jgi:UDP-3-O-[3-hydroxymyristoyl] N-acetylglucosamine deacetylase
MDGFSDLTRAEVASDSSPSHSFGSSGVGSSILRPSLLQRTLKTAISCVGHGLHSGCRVNLTLRPATPGHGIVFRRVDLVDADIPARFDHVVDTRMCTVLGRADQPDIRVATVEHLMAALYGTGIDNVLIEIDGPEVPILDGSAASFVFLLQCAGSIEQDATRPLIEIRHPVRVSCDDAYAELLPSDVKSGRTGLEISMSIDFDATAIGRQALAMQLTPATFAADLASARTFTLASEIAGLQAAGLARGGSLQNAIVVDDDRVLNPGGLRMADEFVRHKTLDVVGDLALANAMISGRFVAHRSGHTLNNNLLRAVFADETAWRYVPAGRPGKFRTEWLPAAA